MKKILLVLSLALGLVLSPTTSKPIQKDSDFAYVFTKSMVLASLAAGTMGLALHSMREFTEAIETNQLTAKDIAETILHGARVVGFFFFSGKLYEKLFEILPGLMHKQSYPEKPHFDLRGDDFSS